MKFWYIFISWFKKSDGLTTATKKGDQVLAADETCVAEAEAAVQRAQAKLDQAVAAQKEDAAKVASDIQAAMAAADAELAQEADASTKAIAKADEKLACEKAAILELARRLSEAATKRRDETVSEIEEKLGVDYDRVEAEQAEASRVLEAALEVLDTE